MELPIEVIPALGAVGAVTGGLALRQRRIRHRARAEDEARIAAAWHALVPHDGLEIAVHVDQTHRADRSGRMMLVLVGTFGEHQGAALLRLMAQCGLEGAIGSVLVLEGDARRRDRFFAEVADGAPAFLDGRIEAPVFPAISGGMGNADPATVRALIDHWGPAVVTGSSELCRRHRRLHGGNDAALGLVFVGQGGMAMAGPTAIDAITQEFPQIAWYGFTASPVDDPLRQRGEAVLEAYRQAGVRGFVASDNLGDQLANDFGMIAAITGLAAAAETAEAAVEQNNAWHLLFAGIPGGIASYGTYLRMLPGYAVTPRHPEVPARSWTPRPAMVAAIHAGLDQVQRIEHDSLRGTGRNGTRAPGSRFDIVLAAVTPEALKSVEDEIVLGRALKGQEKRNYHLLFAPTAIAAGADLPECPVAVVSLRALHRPRQVLRQLMLLPETRPKLTDALPEASATARLHDYVPQEGGQSDAR